MWKQLALAAWAATLSSGAWAWGAQGHTMVGTIADSLLVGTKAGEESRNILRSNLRTASVWADCARGVVAGKKGFEYPETGKYPECAVYENPGSIKQLVSFVERNTENCSPDAGSESCHKQYHYTNIAIQRPAYSAGLVGTSENDIVAAISAAIQVLQGQESPAPFQIKGKREALRLLAHYVGDIHQPLHVGSVYLNENGEQVDPDEGDFDPSWATRGGNELLVGSRNLHSIWDGVQFGSDQPTSAMLKEAQSVPVSDGAVEDWAASWASESLALARDAFSGVSFSKADVKGKHQAQLPEGYTRSRVEMQRAQVVKAGARLAHILRSIWPD